MVPCQVSPEQSYGFRDAEIKKAKKPGLKWAILAGGQERQEKPAEGIADVRKDWNPDRAECGNLGASRNRESSMPNAAEIRGDDCGRSEKIVLQGSSLL